MKPPNLTLGGKDIKLDHNVTRNCRNKKLVGKLAIKTVDQLSTQLVLATF